MALKRSPIFHIIRICEKCAEALIAMNLERLPPSEKVPFSSSSNSSFCLITNSLRKINPLIDPSGISFMKAIMLSVLINYLTDFKFMIYDFFEELLPMNSHVRLLVWSVGLSITIPKKGKLQFILLSDYLLLQGAIG